ncbi:MAG: HAMP domain-containing histidine kinase, partial [Myxococcales bacterium]|nr:HAMP domain-containing histidine kinase [Myxococcales bacterium]
LEEANQAARRLIGRDIVPGEPVADILQRRGEEHVVIGPDGPIPVAVAETSLQHTSGRRVLLLQDLRPAREAAAREHEALREAEAASRAKSTFLASMSHELRTPLNAILGYAEILEEDAGDAQDKDDLGRILASGRHLLELIDDVLDMSRVESGKVELASEDIELGPIVDQVVASIDVVAERAGLTFVVDGHVERARGDRTRVRQVLLNLLSNAVKFGSSSVGLRVSQEGDEVRFDVWDDGSGVPEALLPRLFQPFARGHADLPGTGLGLALSREFAVRMGGDLRLFDEPGPTTFRFVLPARQPARRRRPSRPPALSPVV